MVAPPSLFPPLTIFAESVQVDLADGQPQPQVQEDVRILLGETIRSDEGILPRMHFNEWRTLLDRGSIDPRRKVRRLGGLANRIMGLDKIHH